MNKDNSLFLKLDATLMFIDLKVFMIVYMLFDFYRETSLRADVFQSETISTGRALRWIWENVGSPYVKWVPIVIIGDFFLKRFVKGLIDV
jgi:hypothetical protein